METSRRCPTKDNCFDGNQRRKRNLGHVSANVDTAKDKAIKYSGTNGSSTTDSGRSKKADTSGSRPGKDGGEEATSAPPPLRTSSRVPKRPRRDNTPPPSPPKKTAKAEAKTTANGTPEAKTRRQWELWSSVDKDIFFEALSEHGKDFDAIQSVIAQRHRKRGSQNLIRTKEQIRHFYYRTWHKISKFIENKDDVSKHAMELYGLINYGELRKRVGGLLNEKGGQRLNELVHKGGTVIKAKGKTYRIRTPVCRALKKLNNIEETKEEEQVVIPKNLVLELMPASNGAWSTIQAISHNPRLRLHLPSNKRLSSVIEFLNNKWKSQRLRLKETMNVTERMSKELRLAPPDACELYPFDVKPIGAQPNLNLGLEKFKDAKEKCDGTRSPAAKRLKRSTTVEEHHSEDSAHSMEDAKNSSSATDSVEKKDGKTDQTGVSNGPEKDSKGKSSDKTVDKNTCKLEKGSKQVLTDKNSENKSGRSTVTQQNANVQVDNEAPADKDAQEKDEKASAEELKKERVAKLREGWNLKEAEGLTIAELYLLMGCPEKLCLEYDWVDLVKNQNVIQMNLALSNMLRRLVQLATTEFSDFSKNKPPMVGLEPSSPPKTCTCGAFSAGTPPGRGVTKSPRITGAGNPPGKSPSTPKSSQRPGSATTPKTPGSKQCNGVQPIQKAPEQSESASLASSQVTATGSAGDGVFRVPNPVPVRGQTQLLKISPTSLAERQLLQQIEIHKQRDILMPKRQKKQVMRNVRRPLVVQRTLLPKMGVPTRTIMALNIGNQSQMAQTGAFMPVIPQQGQNLLHVRQQPTEPTTISIGKITTPQPCTSGVVATTENAFPVTSTSQNMPQSSQKEQPSSAGSQVSTKSQSTSLLSQAAAAAGITSSGISDIQEQVQSSDSNLSSLLDISLPAPDNTNDSISSESSFISSIRNTTFSGLLDAPMTGQVEVDVNEDSLHPPSASSPNKSFKLNSTLGPDSQWMGGEDFSLSQFLTDSPLKKSSIDPSLVSECSRDSIRLDVDTALQSMMNENSMDYSTKFADLAAQIAASAPEVVLVPKK